METITVLPGLITNQLWSLFFSILQRRNESNFQRKKSFMLLIEMYRQLQDAMIITDFNEQQNRFKNTKLNIRNIYD